MNYQSLSDDDKLWLARIDDLIEQVLKYKKPQFTQFCDPHAVAVFKEFASVSSFVKIHIWGGYSDSERKVIGFFPEFSEPSEALFPVSALSIKGAGDLSHREFLGSVMALGMKRSMVGDIIIDVDKTILFCMESICDYILMNLNRIGRQKVEIAIEDACRLSLKPKEFIEISGTVASLRLDCVLGLATKESRSKVQELIKQELVNVNWAPASEPSYQVLKGDVISMRKFGRMEVGEILGTSKKGRIKIVLKKYV